MFATRFARGESAESRGNWLLPRFLLFPVLAIAGYVGLIGEWGGPGWLPALLWVLFIGYCWFCIGACSHELVHSTLLNSPRLNVLIGRVIGVFLVIPYTVYRETHVRHHAYLNTPLDTELWPYCDPRRSLRFRRCFAMFDILLGPISAPIIYGRLYFAQHAPLKPEVRRAIRREYLASAVFWGVVVLGLAVAAATDSVDLRWRHLLWFAPMLVAAGLNTLRKMTEHLGLASYDPLLGTRTVVSGNWLTRICSYFNFEIFVHGPHHRHPRVPHYRLEDTLQSYQAANPNVDYPVFSSYLAAFFDMLPMLFRNPGVGLNVDASVPLPHFLHVDDFVGDVQREILDHQPPPSD